jgi:ABC-type ATPase involved in cell division
MRRRLIRLFHVSKSYAAGTALRDVSVEVKKGELFLIGLSGAARPR